MSAALLAALLACAPEPEPEPPTLPEAVAEGRWRTRAGIRPGEADAELLAALGYAEGVLPAPERAGVVLHDPARAAPGYNLVASGHAPQAVLLDMEGRVVHAWERSWEQTFPGREPVGPQPRGYWRRARLLPGGGLLTLFVGYGVVRLDRSSRVVWVWEGTPHHDVRVVGDAVWTLTRSARGEALWDDEITILDLETGAHRRTLSLADALEAGGRSHLLEGREGRDLLHANTVTPDGDRALVTVRELDALVWVDLAGGAVDRVLVGDWEGPHEGTRLEDGGLLLFDNLGHWPRSRALELDVEGRPRWSWDGGGTPIASRTCGAAHALPNGNRLVVASNMGRATEVTGAGEVVWDFWSPARTRVEGEELIANLFDVVRVPEGAWSGE